MVKERDNRCYRQLRTKCCSSMSRVFADGPPPNRLHTPRLFQKILLIRILPLGHHLIVEVEQYREA